MPKNDELEHIKKVLFPHTKRVFIVGGTVRDLLLERENTDVDLEVFDLDLDTFCTLMQSVGAKGVGKSFFVFRVGNIDISLPRIERKVSFGHRGFEVAQTNDMRLACSRRDFTINSMMINVFSGEFIDFFGGKEDLGKKRLKMVNQASFGEDSLRTLRALSFAARLGFEIDNDTLDLASEMDLKDLSSQRVFLELQKFFNAPFMHEAIDYFFALKLDKKLLGLRFGSEQIKRLKSLLSKKNTPYSFLYFLREVVFFDMQKMLKKIDAPNRYKTFFKSQPRVDEIKDYTHLLKLALILPLKSWLGLSCSGFEDLAKRLDLYDKPYKSKVCASDLMQKGFVGKELGEQLQKERLKDIERYFKKTMGPTHRNNR